jgi:hypothetical protein
MLILFFLNVLKILNFEKSAKTSKNLKKQQKNSKKNFNQIVVAFGPKGMPERMCDIVR